MGLLDSLGGKVIEKRWQCIFRDDDMFQFRKLELEDTFLIERDKTKAVSHGWKHLYSNQFPCPGYKQAHIPPCAVTFSHPRDIIFEVIPGLVPNGERPDGGRSLDRKQKFSFLSEKERLKEVVTWCANVGNQRLLRIAAKKSKQPSMDRLIMWLGVFGILELVGLLMSIAFSGGIKLK